MNKDAATRSTSARRTASAFTPSVRPGDPLTPREIEVLTLIAHGNQYKEAARQLNLSPQTIKNHMSNVLVKLDAWNATHAVYLYFVCNSQQGANRD